MEETFKERSELLKTSINSSLFALSYDEEDSLRSFRQDFLFPPPPEGIERKQTIYLCGM